MPGRRTLVEPLAPAASPLEPHRAPREHAAAGVAGKGGALPFQDRIQRSFGAHDVSGVRAHTDAAAAQGNAAMGSHAYAHGNDIAFAGEPDLHTAAHEAAHVVQQRAGVQLAGGVGADGDAYEQQANAVADAVVAGDSAEALLATMTPSSGAPAEASVQHQRAPRPASSAASSGAAPAVSPAAASAGVTSVTPVAAPSSTRPASAAAAPATPPDAIARRFPHGITVAIALLPREPDVIAARLRAERPMFKATFDHFRAMLPGSLRSIQGLLKIYNTAPDHTITDDEANAIDAGLIANDRAFARAADAFGHAHRVVGGDPSAPVVGRPLLFHREDDAIAMIRALSQSVGPLPGAANGGNISHLAIFTHGGHLGLEVGSTNGHGANGGAARFVGQLGGTLTHDVLVGVYGCNAAQEESDGRHSFSQNVAEGLAREGHNARVFGHTTAAHTTQNPRGREFVAHAGQTTPATSHTNQELVFDAQFRAAQIRRIAHELGATEADVERVFDDATSNWLLNRMGHIPVPGGQVAAFQMGFDPESAVRACRETWVRDNEGLAAIRRALAPPAASHAHRHR